VTGSEIHQNSLADFIMAFSNHSTQTRAGGNDGGFLFYRLKAVVLTCFLEKKITNH